MFFVNKFAHFRENFPRSEGDRNAESRGRLILAGQDALADQARGKSKSLRSHQASSSHDLQHHSSTLREPSYVEQLYFFSTTTGLLGAFVECGFEHENYRFL